MNIEKIVIPAKIENKIEYKHNVKDNEVRQILINNPRIRFAEKGNVQNNDIYPAFGKTFGGRYLSVFFIYKPENKTSIIISARDMSKKEREKRMERNKLTSISKAKTYEQIGKFWDLHDFTEFDDEKLSDVQFEISCKISVEPDLLSLIERQAKLRKIDTEPLPGKPPSVPCLKHEE
jgi:uncharacterized protein